MASKRRRIVADDASNFVTVQHIRENHTFSVIAKVMSKSGIMKFECTHCHLFCVFFKFGDEMLYTVLGLVLHTITLAFEVLPPSNQGHVQTESLGLGLKCRTANMAIPCG